MLTEIELKQFKTFKDEYIELAPLTLLTGINGMGKSTVLQSLLVLRQSYDSGSLHHGKLIIEGELVNLVSPNDLLCSTADNTKLAISITDGGEVKGVWTVNAEGSSNSLAVRVENTGGDIYQSPLFAPSFQYLNAERIGPRVDFDRIKVSRAHSPIGYRGEWVASRLLEVLDKNEVTALPNLRIRGVSPAIYDQLSAWISEIIYNGTKLSIDSSNAARISLKYSFAEERTKTFNPMNIGFGFSFALPVILAVLTAKPSSLLIVENPEAHLHPRGQSRMGMLLALAAQSGIQVIIESHSDHLLNGIRLMAKGDERLGRLDADKAIVHFFQSDSPVSSGRNTKRTLRISNKGKLDGWPNGFFDEWESNLRKLLK